MNTTKITASVLLGSILVLGVTGRNEFHGRFTIDSFIFKEFEFSSSIITASSSSDEYTVSNSLIDLFKKSGFYKRLSGTYELSDTIVFN